MKPTLPFILQPNVIICGFLLLATEADAASKCRWVNGQYVCRFGRLNTLQRVGIGIGVAAAVVLATMAFLACRYWVKWYRNKPRNDTEKNIPPPNPRLPSFSRRSSGFTQLPDQPTIQNPPPAYHNALSNKSSSRTAVSEATKTGKDPVTPQATTDPNAITTNSRPSEAHSSGNSLGFKEHWLNSSDDSGVSGPGSSDLPSPLPTSQFSPASPKTPKVVHPSSPTSLPSAGVISQSSTHSSARVPPLPPPPITIPQVVVSSPSTGTGQSMMNSRKEIHEPLPPYQAEAPPDNTSLERMN
ncbi:hypothetical protein FRC03_005049 [Tulasnella sp. 419]|nr:hypothetical protein FRC03_005049 [Tulasnella sp. 419]